MGDLDTWLNKVPDTSPKAPDLDAWLEKVDQPKDRVQFGKPNYGPSTNGIPDSVGLGTRPNKVETYGNPITATAEQNQKMGAARQWAFNKLASEPDLGSQTLGGVGVGVRDFLENSIPVVSTGLGFKARSDYQKALAAKERGDATDKQLGDIAEFELKQQRVQAMGLGRRTLQGALNLPAIAGEAFLAGPVAELGAGAVAPVAGKVAGTVAGKALQGAVLPSLVLPAAQERQAEQGGEWYDPKNLGPAMGVSAAKNVILGTVGGQIGKVNANLPTRVIAAAALGIAENQVSDLALTAVDKFLPEAYKTKTELGTIGHALRGEQGAAWQSLAGDAVAFGVFSLAHGKETNQVELLAKADKALGDDGIPPAERPKVLSDAAKTPETAPEGPVKDFAEAMKPPETPTEAPKTPNAEAKPETAQPAPEPVKATETAPQEAVPDPEPVKPPEVPPEAPKEPDVTGLKKEFDAQERARLNLPPGPEADPVGHSFPELRQQVLDIAQKDPFRPQRLADELAAKPRNVSDIEAALLLKRAVDLNVEHKRANAELEAAHVSGDPARIAEAQHAEAAARDKYHEVRNAAKATGAEQGRGLNAWKLMAKDDFSLAAMMSERKNRQGGKFDEKDREAVVAANKKIEELQNKVDALQARDRQAATEKANVREFAKPLGQRTKAARAEVDAAWDELRQVTKGKLFSNPADPEALIAAAKLTKAYIKLGVAKFSDFVAEVRAKSSKPLSAEAEDLLKKGWETAHNELANERAQKRIAKQAETVKGKITAGDFSKPEPKEPFKPSKETFAAQAELARLQNEWREGNLRAEAAQRPKYQKAMAMIAKWYRGSILSSPVTLAKLTSAAVERTVFAPMQNVVGAGVGKVFPKLAAKATFEAGFNVRQEARAFTKGWMNWMKDARDVMKTNNMDIGHKYGVPHFDVDPSFADYMGRFHYALKTPAKRASYERAMERGTEAAIREGLDVTDPAVQMRLGVEAYKHAERSIFQQDNILVDMWKRAINVHPTAKFIGDMTLPIVRVPTNIVIESFNHALGSIAAPARLTYAKLFAGGVEKMTPAQADSILRQFKQGFTGLGMMALGFYNKDDVGGYYDPKDKRKEGDVGFGEMRIFGKKVPSYLIHNPLLEMVQLGATVARASEKKVKGQEQGHGVGVAKALLGLAEETPFVREATNVEKMAEGDVQGVAGGKLRSLLVPQGLQWVAGNLDKKTPFNPQEDPIKRKAERDKGLRIGIGQEIQKGVPFARNRLAEK